MIRMLKKRLRIFSVCIGADERGISKMLSLYDPLHSSKSISDLYHISQAIHFPVEEGNFIRNLRIMFQDDIHLSQYSDGYLALLWNWAYYIVLRQENFVLEN